MEPDTSVPDPIGRMSRTTKQAFSRAAGKTFQIEAFDERGAELDLSGKVARAEIVDVFTSSNPLMSWLRQLDRLRTALSVGCV